MSLMPDRMVAPSPAGGRPADISLRAREWPVPRFDPPLARARVRAPKLEGLREWKRLVLMGMSWSAVKFEVVWRVDWVDYWWMTEYGGVRWSIVVFFAFSFLRLSGPDKALTGSNIASPEIEPPVPAAS